MPKDVQEILAANMRRLRGERGWSQEQLAQACKLHRTYIGAVERCERNPSVKSVAKIATALAVEPWVLLAPPQSGDVSAAVT